MRLPRRGYILEETSDNPGSVLLGLVRRDPQRIQMANILIVDDEPSLLRTVRTMLERQGHSVSQASDGKSALRQFEETPFDLVISDIYMPEMDGVEFLIRLHQLFPRAKIVAMSGGGRLPKDKALRTMSTLGAIDILEKPFPPRELEEVVRKALEK